VTRNGKKISSKKFDYQPSAASIHPNQTEIAVGSQTVSGFEIHPCTKMFCKKIKVVYQVVCSVISLPIFYSHLNCISIVWIMIQSVI
jgi:hypothetical protein